MTSQEEYQKSLITEISDLKKEILKQEKELNKSILYCRFLENELNLSKDIKDYGAN